MIFDKMWMVQKMRQKIGSLIHYQLMGTRRNEGFNTFIPVIRCTQLNLTVKIGMRPFIDCDKSTKKSFLIYNPCRYVFFWNEPDNKNINNAISTIPVWRTRLTAQRQTSFRTPIFLINITGSPRI